MPSAAIIELTAAQRHRIKKLARSQRMPYRVVVRARIVHLAARGLPNATIAGRLNVTDDTVRTWRGRFAADGMAGLTDRPRSGRPPKFTPLQRAEVMALACSLPATSVVPLSKWSCPELATEVVSAGIAEAMSASTVRRILAKDVIKPWQHRSWISVRDPNFATKATRVLELYQRRWNGQPLGADEYVISSDEKTSIQARCRCHPTLPPGRSRSMRVEHDYDRGGALAYLAAYDVHRGTVIGRCAPTTGIQQPVEKTARRLRCPPRQESFVATQQGPRGGRRVPPCRWRWRVLGHRRGRGIRGLSGGDAVGGGHVEPRRRTGTPGRGRNRCARTARWGLDDRTGPRGAQQ